MTFVLPKLYPITDTRLSRLSHAEQVERLAAGGATLIQLREKQASPRQFYEAAIKAMRVARALKVKLIINDRVDVALAVDADGAHLGQGDLPPETARALLGSEKIVGYSTHNLKQALTAASLPIDYLAIGPVFPTSTKENPDPIVGLDELASIASQVAKPLVAIGGVTLANAAAAIAAGASSVAVIFDLFATGDPGARVGEYLKGCLADTV